MVGEFDPVLPEFRFNTGTEKAELHRALLRLLPSIEGRLIAHFDKELEEQPVEPLGGESTESFYRRLVQDCSMTVSFSTARCVERYPHSRAFSVNRSCSCVHERLG